MAIPSWPTTLPQELTLDGYSQSAADNIIKSSPDIGPAKVRRRSTAAVRPVSGTLILNETGLEDFKDFFKEDLLDGSIRFSWADPDDGSTAVEMRFTSPPAWTALGGGLSRVSMELEILP
jgi:hypothetical protein